MNARTSVYDQTQANTSTTSNVEIQQRHGDGSTKLISEKLCTLVADTSYYRRVKTCLLIILPEVKEQSDIENWPIDYIHRASSSADLTCNAKLYLHETTHICFVIFI